MMTKSLIPHDSFNKGLWQIHYCFSNPGSTLLIKGVSGVGKTSMIQQISKIFEGTEQHKQILSVHVPLPFRISDFLSILLIETIASQYDRGSSHQKKETLISIIKETGIKLLVIDDFEHILKERRLSIEVIGMLKEILFETGISLVAFTSDIDKPNVDLSRFFQREYFIKELSYRTEEEKGQFKSILRDIEKQLGFEKSSDLSEFSDEIHEFTKGNFGQITTLISGAEFLAKKNKVSNIILEYLYHSSDGMYRAPRINPFYKRLLSDEKSDKILSKIHDEKIKTLDVISNRELIFEYETFMRLQQTREIDFKVFQDKSEGVQENRDLSNVPERAIHIAELRYKIIKPLLDNPEMTVDDIITQIYQNKELQNEMKKNYFSFSKSSIYRWLKRYRENNHDKLSLVSKYYNKPTPGKSTLHPEVVYTIDRIILAAFSQKVHLTIGDIYNQILTEIRKRNEKYPQEELKFPSLRTVYRRKNLLMNFKLSKMKYM